MNKFNEEQKRPVENRVEIFLPERLDLDDNYEATVTHLTNVRLASRRNLRGFRLKYLNFDGIRYVSPSAALLLASEIDRWNEAVRGRLRARTDAWDISAEALQVLGDAAKEVGVDQAQLTKSLREMTKSISDAATYTGDSTILFDQLGVSVQKLIGLSVEDQFTEIATAIANAEDKQKAFQATAAIFGSRTGPQMKELLSRLAKEGYGQLAAEIKETWGIMVRHSLFCMRPTKYTARFGRMLTL